MILALEIIGGVFAIVGGLIGLYQFFKKCFKSALKGELLQITLDLENIHKDIRQMDKQRCESFLVRFLNEKENNIPQNAEYERLAHEIKDRAKPLGVNSYIKRGWIKLTDEEW